MASKKIAKKATTKKRAAKAKESVGPNAQCRIGAAADIECRRVTSVSEVTDAAIAAWASAPVSK